MTAESSDGDYELEQDVETGLSMQSMKKGTHEGSSDLSIARKADLISFVHDPRMPGMTQERDFYQSYKYIHRIKQNDLLKQCGKKSPVMEYLK
jgi:hypothetical protein